MDIKDKIRQFILKEVCLDETIQDLADEDLLLETGIIDSMGVLNLLAFLEENYGILLEEGEINPKNFATLKSICDLVAQKSAKGS